MDNLKDRSFLYYMGHKKQGRTPIGILPCCYGISLDGITSSKP